MYKEEGGRLRGTSVRSPCSTNKSATRKALRKWTLPTTLVLYSSDNGGLAQATSGGRAKKGSIYEGGLRVPTILEWPAKYKPGTIDTPAFSLTFTRP